MFNIKAKKHIISEIMTQI